MALGNLPNIATICIVIDLTKPMTALDSLNYWYKTVKEYLKESLKNLQK